MHSLTPIIAQLVADISTWPGVTKETIRSGVRLLSQSSDYTSPRRLVSEFLTLVYALPSGQPKSVQTGVHAIAWQLEKELAALPENVSNMTGAQRIMLTGILEGAPAEDCALRAVDAITANDLVAEDEDEDEDGEDYLTDVLVTPFGRLFVGRNFGFNADAGTHEFRYYTIDAAPRCSPLSGRRMVHQQHHTLEQVQGALKALLQAA